MTIYPSSILYWGSLKKLTNTWCGGSTVQPSNSRAQNMIFIYEHNSALFQVKPFFIPKALWKGLSIYFTVSHAFSHTLLYLIFIIILGFPGGAVVENLPANAGDTGSSAGLGRSHMPRSSWAREPQLLSLRVWSLCSATREAATVRGPRTAMKSGPRLPQLEKALAQKRRPNTAKNK